MTDLQASALSLDPRSGLLYEDASLPGSFTLDLKKTFLGSLPQYYPNISYVCRLHGVSRAQFDRHLRLDPVFRERIKDIEVSCTDEVELELLKAAKGKSFLDRIAWLRAHRPEKYMETQRVIVDKWDTSPERARDKENRLANAIDTELVEPRIMKAIEITKQVEHGPQALGAGDGGAGPGASATGESTEGGENPA